MFEILLLLIIFLRRRDDGVDPPDQLDSYDRLPKSVICENCCLEFVYFVNAADRGFQHLEMTVYTQSVQGDEFAEPSCGIIKFMKNACAEVPCPKCGHYQADMVRLARRNQYRWMIKLALVLVPISLILFLGARVTTSRHSQEPTEDNFVPMVIFWVLCCVAAALVFLLPLIRHFLTAHYDLNNNVKDNDSSFRRVRAFSMEDYLRFVEDRRRRLEERKRRMS